MTTVNDNVKLHCYATGYPRPQLQWLRNGVKITKEGAPQRDYELIKEDNGLGLTLSITEIQKEDNKVHYTCVAANMFGNATRTIAVYVKGKKRYKLNVISYICIGLVVQSMIMLIQEPVSLVAEQMQITDYQ